MRCWKLLGGLTARFFLPLSLSLVHNATSWCVCTGALKPLYELFSDRLAAPARWHIDVRDTWIVVNVLLLSRDPTLRSFCCFFLRQPGNGSGHLIWYSASSAARDASPALLRFFLCFWSITVPLGRSWSWRLMFFATFLRSGEFWCDLLSGHWSGVARRRRGRLWGRPMLLVLLCHSTKVW